MALGLFAIAGLAVLIAALGLGHARPTTLPPPTGPLKVGRITYDWKDETQPDPYAPTRGIKRELSVWIWYPAAPTASLETVEYLPDYWRRALEQHEGFILGKLLSRDLTSIKTHSLSAPDVSTAQAKYPVIILRAGGGALSTDFTSLAEDLASNGHIVVSFDAPYRTVLTAFPDGRVITRTAGGDFDNLPRSVAEPLVIRVMAAWLADINFVLDKLQQLDASDAAVRFKGKLDLQRVGLVGHLLGGATVAQFCHDDPRCKAGIDIDGMPFGSVIQDGLSQPFFFILSDHHKEPGPEGQRVAADIESIYSRLPEGKRWQVTILGANHFSFSDQMLEKNPVFVTLLQKLGVFGSLDKRRGLVIASACVHTFFDVYLKGAPLDSLNRLPAQYRELQPGVAQAFAPGR